MAELAILDPRVLPRVVAEYDAPEDLIGKSLVTQESDIQPKWEYDIEVYTGAALRKYVAPNSEAILIDQTPVGHMEGSYAYQRLKKRFNPSTLRLLRRVGEGLASSAAGEQRVVRETEVMRQEMMRAEEAAIWDMIQGSWTFTTESGVAYTIDYGVPANHKVSVANTWGNSGDDPIGDIAAIKRRIQRDCGYPISRAYMNEPTMTKFKELPEVSGGINSAAATTKQGQLSDEQKREFQNERRISRFHGIDWIEYDAGYLSAGIGSMYTPYIPDNKIIFMVNTSNNPFVFQYGPSIDDDAPADWTGPFSKTWKEPDPSARQVLIEVQYMPILLNPFKVASLNIA